jgi:V/A-type H+-transporting ATPase subunit E
MDKIEELEKAILDQAKHLAQQYRQQATHASEDIVRESNEKLQLREQKEVLLAKAEAERVYRRMVQSSELKLQAHTDQLGWNIVTSTEDRLVEQLHQLVNERVRYQPILIQFLIKSVILLQEEEVVILVNETDYLFLQSQLEQIQKQLPPQFNISINKNTKNMMGGVVVKSKDNRKQIDNSFEGRIRRMRQRLHQRIYEQMLLKHHGDISRVTS